MDYSKLGLDTGLVDAVKAITEASCSSKKMEKEELHPNQKKIDKNKNGKLDAQDFKMLRKEEEEIDEAKDTVEKDAAGKVKSWSHEGDWKKSKGTDGQGKVANLSDKARRATEKLTKEQVEEIEALATKHGLTEE